MTSEKLASTSTVRFRMVTSPSIATAQAYRDVENCHLLVPGSSARLGRMAPQVMAAITDKSSHLTRVFLILMIAFPVRKREGSLSLGHNLHDHPNIGVLFPYSDSYRVPPELPRYQVILRYTAPDSQLRNDMQIFFSSFATRRVDRGGTGMESLGVCFLPVLNHAASQGELGLQSAEPTMQPRLDYHLLDEEFDRQRIRREGERDCTPTSQAI